MIIENFDKKARSVAGTVMSASVIAAGVSNTTPNTYMNNNNNFGQTQNAFEPSFLPQPFMK